MIVASVVLHAVIVAAAATTDDPTSTTAHNCTMFGIDALQMKELDKLASHTDKHEFTGAERKSADAFITHYEAQEEYATDKKKTVGGPVHAAPSAACKALYDAMEKSIKDAKNGAPRRPVAHALMALLSLATMAHLSDQF